MIGSADTRAMLYALIDVISSELSDGKSVKPSDIGSFRSRQYVSGRMVTISIKVLI